MLKTAVGLGVGAASGAEINDVISGSGPAVLLLHGYPENHLMWRKVAPELAKSHTVVAADLRGYGDSSKPAGGGDHSDYSKRAMPQDQVELMRSLGFTTFAVVGHDRGGRVAHRMARDHRDVVSNIAVLDIVPAGTLYHSVSRELATAYYHRFFLIQPAPFPETLPGNSVEFSMKRSIGSFPPDGIEEGVYAVYLRTLRDPAAIHASCEDYRAGNSIDLEHDAADLANKISCPLLGLWLEKGPLNRLYDVLGTWKDFGDQRERKCPARGAFSCGGKAGRRHRRTYEVLERVTEGGREIPRRAERARLGMTALTGLLLLNNRRGLAPLAGENEGGNWLALAFAGFGVAQASLGQLQGVARIAQRDARDGFEVFGDAEDFARLVRNDSGHLVDLQAKRRCFEREICGGLANVVKRVAILRAVVRHFMRGHADRNHGRIFRPGLVELHESA
jgi:haloacetate dehalogenase